MAVPIIPILKKAAAAVVSDKKALKVVLGIVLGILFLLTLPFLVIIGVLSGGANIDKNQIQQSVIDRQENGANCLLQIEDEMTLAGFDESRVKEAQTLYLLVLYDKENEEDFVTRLVGCFSLEQTDEQLIEKVNAEFETSISAEDFTTIMQDVRENE